TQKKKDTSKYVLQDFEKITSEQFLAMDDRKIDSFLKQNRMSKYSSVEIKKQVESGKLKPTVLFEHLFDANTALFDTPIIGCEMYRSENGGQTWRKTNTEDLTLDNTYGYYFGKIFVLPYNVYGGLQDNRSWAGPSTYKESIDWIDGGEYAYKFIGGGDRMQVQVDTRDNQTVYSGFQVGFYTRQNTLTKDFKPLKPSHEL